MTPNDFVKIDLHTVPDPEPKRRLAVLCNPPKELAKLIYRFLKQQSLPEVTSEVHKTEAHRAIEEGNLFAIQRNENILILYIKDVPKIEG